MSLRFIPIILATLFLATHWGAVIYVNSSLLGKFFSPGTVSLLFVLGALGNILVFLFAPRLIERIGKRPLLIGLLSLALLAATGFAVGESAFLIALSFIVHSSFLYVIFYCLDIFIEELSDDVRTGTIRGAYLTTYNLGIMLGPLTLSIFPNETLRPVYLSASVLLSLTLILSLFLKSTNPERHGLHHRALLPLKQWWRTKSLRRSTLAKLALESFYALMVIFTPVYLHQILGFDWGQIGVMFTIMLLPFVLFQWIVGRLADHYFGEKEFMIVGFLLIGTALWLMPNIPANFLAWAAILFLSRAGASFVEVTSDSYFFKHVDARDTGLLSIFRLARPTSIVIGATVGALALNFFSFEKIFYVVLIIAFFGLKEALLLRDTL